MRLLVITNDFPPNIGGVENYTYSLIKRWRPEDVVVMTRWVEGGEKFDCVFDSLPPIHCLKVAVV